MRKWKELLLITVIFAGCKKPYVPPVINAPNSYLVVEGAINIGPDSTIINLSRTVNLSAGSTTNPETAAKVTVESDANASIPLIEIRSGHYFAFGLNLDNTKQYRLRIITSNNKQYVSDFVAAQVTPPIDSVGFNILSNGLQIYVNAHDATNKTQYYRWDFTEAWQFHAEFSSLLVTVGHNIIPRPFTQQIYSCFGSDTSGSVILASTSSLKQDLIYQYPLATIPSSSEKLETKYSILVRQYALTGDAYNFWTNLKKNTEQLGTIFDAQPSTSGGNIHNVNNSSEPVIGYISACVVQSKRIFVSNSQLPLLLSWETAYPYSCVSDSTYFVDPLFHGANTVQEFLLMPPPQLIPINTIYSNAGLIGYQASSPICVDCTLRGSKIQPVFWK